MRVSFVINSLSIGGAERNLAALAAAFAARGAEAQILTFRNETPALLPPAGVRVTPVVSGAPAPPFRNALRVLAGLRREIRRADPDVVLSFMDQANLLALLASFGSRARVIVAERVDPARSSLLEPSQPALVRALASAAREILYRFAARVIVQTEGAAARFSKGLRKRLEVIPNPVLPPPDGRPDLDLPAPCILGMGRLMRQKRFDLLIEAFAAIAGRYPPWHLAIVGAGPLAGELRALAAARGLAHRVSLPGATNTPHAVLKQAAVFALSSDYEGFPGALAEALACGVPAVATDCEFGPREIVRHETDGLLVPPGNPAELAAALERLVSSGELRARLSMRGPEVIERFGADEIFGRWWAAALRSSAAT